MMHQSEVTNAQIAPRFLGLMMTLLGPSDSEGNWRGTGTGTDPMLMLSYFSIANVIWCLTFLTKLNRSSFSHPSERTHQITSTSMIYAIDFWEKNKESPLAPSYTNKELADRFNDYFINKIIKICTNLTGKHQHLPLNVETPAPPRDTEA